jgi:hypothetical protein
VGLVVFGAEGRVLDAEAIVECGFGVFAADIVDFFIVLWVGQMDFVGCDADYRPWVELAEKFNST